MTRVALSVYSEAEECGHFYRHNFSLAVNEVPRVHSASASENYYELLAIQRDASRSEIRRAFLRLAHVCHPDLNGQDLQAEIRFRHIRQAYEVLYDPSSRAAYDDHLRGKTQAAACRQEWPRSKPIVTNPPERPPVEWMSGEIPAEIGDWSAWRVRALATIGVSVASIVLTIITMTHVRAHHQQQSTRPGGGDTYGNEVQHSSGTGIRRSPEPPSEFRQFHSPSNEAAEALPKGDDTQSPSSTADPNGPFDAQVLNEVIDSAESLKTLQKNESSAPLVFLPHLTPPVPRFPQLDWNQPESSGSSTRLEISLPEPEVRTTPFGQRAVPLRPEAPQASQWIAPSNRPARADYLSWDSRPSGNGDRMVSQPPIAPATTINSGTYSSVYDGAGAAESRPLYYPYTPPTTNSARPSWQRANTSGLAVGNSSPDGLNTSGLSAPSLSGPAAYSGWSPNSDSTTGMPTQAARLPDSTWSKIPRQPAPTAGTPPTNSFVPPASTYRPSTLGSTPWISQPQRLFAPLYP